MPTLRDFQLSSCQATLFTPDAEVSAARLLARLLPRWIERFDAEPTVLPMPDAIPKEIPRVILQSRTGQWRCEVASARMNLFWRRTAVEGQAMTLVEVFRVVVPILHEYVDFVDSRVGRLAAVISRYVENAAPARFLASHFCKERWLAAPFNRPESFELHSHKTFLLADRFQTNSWVRNKTGTLTEPGVEGARPIVLVEQDFNTLGEELDTRTFSNEEISRFFDAVGPGFDDTLRLYYPDEVA